MAETKRQELFTLTELTPHSLPYFLTCRIIMEQAVKSSIGRERESEKEKDRERIILQPTELIHPPLPNHPLLYMGNNYGTFSIVF